MKKPFAVLPLVLTIAIGAAGIYWLLHDGRKAETPATAQTLASAASAGGFGKALAVGPVAGFLVHDQRKDIAPFTFMDGTGKQVDLGQWKGKVVLLNLWATWCAPCRKEMPDLVKLNTTAGGPDFEVVALSVDRKGLEASQAFLKEIGADSLKPYADPESKSLGALQALGLPASILIDRKGREAGRILGPADWSSPEALALVTTLKTEAP